MAGRKRMRLTDASVDRLRPREREYTVWDSRVPGLGVRVRPSGGKSYVLLLRSGGRSRRASLGPVSLRTVAEARRDCLVRQAAHEPDSEPAPRRAVPSFREFVEGEWARCAFQALQALDQERHPLAARQPPDAGVRAVARSTA